MKGRPFSRETERHVARLVRANVPSWRIERQTGVGASTVKRIRQAVRADAVAYREPAPPPAASPAPDALAGLDVETAKVVAGQARFWRELATTAKLCQEIAAGGDFERKTFAAVTFVDILTAALASQAPPVTPPATEAAP